MAAPRAAAGRTRSRRELAESPDWRRRAQRLAGELRWRPPFSQPRRLPAAGSLPANCRRDRRWRRRADRRRGRPGGRSRRGSAEYLGLLQAAIRALLRQRLKHVGHRDDPCLGRRPPGITPEGVAMAIQCLVMKSRPLRDLLQAGDVSQNLVGSKACRSMTENSRGVRLVGLSTISSGTQSLPTSCIRPATSIFASASSSKPTRLPRWRASWATPTEWAAVKWLLASTMLESTAQRGRTVESRWSCATRRAPDHRGSARHGAAPARSRTPRALLPRRRPAPPPATGHCRQER